MADTNVVEELAESWVNGNLSAVREQILEMPKALAMSTAVDVYVMLRNYAVDASKSFARILREHSNV